MLIYQFHTSQYHILSTSPKPFDEPLRNGPFSEKAFIETLFNFEAYADSLVSYSIDIIESEPNENEKRLNVNWDISEYKRKGAATTTLLEIDM
jgi:hypothetical protein